MNASDIVEDSNGEDEVSFAEYRLRTGTTSTSTPTSTSQNHLKSYQMLKQQVESGAKQWITEKSKIGFPEMLKIQVQKLYLNIF